MAGEGQYLGISDPEELLQQLKYLQIKENSLREELRDLRKKEDPPRLPSSYTATKSVSDFGASLVNSTLDDKVLKLPEGVFFLGPDMGSEIFIRQCYPDLADIILGTARNGTMRNVVLTGTPGTGKSVFAMYLLYLLRRQGKTVLVESKKSIYRFSDSEGVERFTAQRFIPEDYLFDKSAWYLCDPEDKAFEGFRGVTVVTISPKRERTKEFLKQRGSIELFMPLWTLEELEECRKRIFPKVSQEEVEYSFTKVGGTAREAFDRDGLLRKMSAMAEKADEVTLEKLQTVARADQSSLTTALAGDSLMVIAPRPGYRTYDVLLASSLASKLIQKALKKKGGNLVEAFLMGNSETNSTAKGNVLGSLFEELCQEKFLASKKQGLRFQRFILNREGIDEVGFDFGSKVGFPGKNIPLTLRYNQLYVPDNLNFEGIDSLGECNGNLFLFQMKFSSIPFPIPITQKPNRLREWGKPSIEITPGRSSSYQKCIFVYVVPDMVGRDMFDKAVATAGKQTWKPIGEPISIDEVWVIAVPVLKETFPAIAVEQ